MSDAMKWGVQQKIKEEELFAYISFLYSVLHKGNTGRFCPLSSWLLYHEYLPSFFSSINAKLKVPFIYCNAQ